MEGFAEKKRNFPDNYVFYLPHHCVLKIESTTTKLRKNFDGLAKNIQKQPFEQCPDDRSYRYCLRGYCLLPILDLDSAHLDYLQMSSRWKDNSDTSDRNFHRALWRSDETKKLPSLRMTKVTYGTASSAHRSTRCDLQIA